MSHPHYYQKKVFFVGGYPPGLIPQALDEHMTNGRSLDAWNFFKQSVTARSVHVSNDLAIRAAAYDNNAWLDIQDHSPRLVVAQEPLGSIFVTPSIPVMALNIAEAPDPFEFGGYSAKMPVDYMRFYLDPRHKKLGLIEGEQALGGAVDHDQAYKNFKGSAIIVPVLEFRDTIKRPELILYQVNYRAGGERIWVTQRSQTKFDPH